MNIAAITPWYGMTMVVNATVPDGGFVMVNGDGEVLSGGNVDTMTVWRRAWGDPVFVYASEAVAEKLIMGGRENGARYAH